MARYTLYGGAFSTYVRTIRMQLSEKGVEYDLVPVNILAGEGQTPEHLARHPFGKIPAFEAGDVRLFETAAIAEFIEGEYPQPPCFPADLAERARMRQWMNVIDNYAYPAIVGTLVWQRVVNVKLGQPTDEQAIADGMPEIHKHFGLLDQALEETPWLAGARACMADFYLAPIMAYVDMTPEAGELMRQYPRVARWWDAAQQLPSFQQTPFDGSR